MKSKLFTLTAAICFMLAGFTVRAGTPEPLKLSFSWPTDADVTAAGGLTNIFGGLTLRDASVYYSFVIVSTPLLGTPVTNWPVKLVIPASSVSIVASNWWQAVFMEDLTFSSFYAMKVTNHVNGTESFFSLPAPWFPTPGGQIRRLTK